MQGICEAIFGRFLEAHESGAFINPKAVVVIETVNGKLTWSTSNDVLFEVRQPEGLLIESIGDEKSQQVISWAQMVRIVVTEEVG